MKRFLRHSFVLAVACGAVLAWRWASPSSASPAAHALDAVPVAPYAVDLSGPGWTEFTSPLKSPNRFEVEGPGSLGVTSRSAASIRWLRVDHGIDDGLCLRWRWRVEEEPVPMDLGERGDDRPLALMVGFAYEGNTVLSKVLKATPFVPSDVPGRTIMYTWGGAHERGDEVESPYGAVMPGRLVILRPGGSPHGEWLAESVSPAEDYRRLFGEEPTLLTHLGITADTDNTRSASHASLADLRFERTTSAGRDR